MYVALSKKRTTERDDDDGFPFTSYIEIFKEGDDNKTRAELAPPFSLRDWSSNISQE